MRPSVIAGRVHERYLRLPACIIHQYLCVGDALILTLQKAVLYFQQRQGEIVASSAVPLDFLDLVERQHVFTETGAYQSGSSGSSCQGTNRRPNKGTHC